MLHKQKLQWDMVTPCLAVEHKFAQIYRFQKCYANFGVTLWDVSMQTCTVHMAGDSAGAVFCHAADHLDVSGKQTVLIYRNRTILDSQ